MAGLVRRDVQRAGRSRRRCVESVAARVCAVGRHALVGQRAGRHDVLGDGDRRSDRLELVRRQHAGVAHDERPIRASRRWSKPRFRRPVSFPGAPAPRFWEMEDARIAYGLVPVGPTDLAHLMMIEYASTYGNDWFVVPLTLPVGSVTRVDSLVVTDTFGVRSLVRPIGDPALPPAYLLAVAVGATGIRASSAGAEDRHEPVLPAADAQPHASTARRSKTCCSCATRWPIWPGRSSAPSRARSSSRRSATKRPMRAIAIRPTIRRARPAALPAVVAGAAELDSAAAGAGAESRCSRRTRPDRSSRGCKRGAVLQPDGTTTSPHGSGRGAAIARRTCCSTTRRSRARAHGSRVSAGWRAGPTARRGCGRRSGTRSDRAKARAR